jgi:hypothetical protein
MDYTDDDADYYGNDIDDLDLGEQLSIPDPTMAINEQREQMYSDTHLAFCLEMQDFFTPKTVTAAAPKTATVTKSSRLQLPSLLRADLGMEMRTPVVRAYCYSPLPMSLRLFIKLILAYSVKLQLVTELFGLDNDHREVPSISRTMFRIFDDDIDDDVEEDDREAEAARRTAARIAREPFTLIADLHDEDPAKFVDQYRAANKQRQLAKWAQRKMCEDRIAAAAARERARRKSQKARRMARRRDASK